MKKHLQRLALLVPSAMVGLLLVELVVRVFFPQTLFTPRPDIWAPADTFGYRNVANADTRADVYGNEVHFATDGDGYRIDTRSGKRACEPDARVLMLGDSFIEGLKVEEDETIPVLSSQRLEKDHGICVQIDNAGVSGWNPNHYYLEARRALALRRHDAGVIFVYTGNDVITAEVDSFPPRRPVPNRRFRFPRSLRWGELVDALVKPTNDILRSRSHAYEMVKGRIRRQVRTANEGRYFPEIHRREFAADPRWGTTADVLARIAREFDAQGVPVLFVVIPQFFQVRVSYFDEYVVRCGLEPGTVDVDQPNVRLRQECEARGLMLLDPLDTMRDRTDVDMYSGWDPHFSVEGNEFLSVFIAPAIAAMLE